MSHVSCGDAAGPRRAGGNCSPEEWKPLLSSERLGLQRPAFQDGIGFGVGVFFVCVYVIPWGVLRRAASYLGCVAEEGQQSDFFFKNNHFITFSTLGTSVDSQLPEFLSPQFGEFWEVEFTPPKIETQFCNNSFPYSAAASVIWAPHLALLQQKMQQLFSLESENKSPIQITSHEKTQTDL